MIDVDDTIVAIASAPGPAPRGIIRVSGPRAIEVWRAVFRPSPAPPAGGSASLDHPSVIDGYLEIAESPRVPARALVWPDQRSYTRQPSFELHTVGAPTLLQWVVEAVCQQGARLAQPGEFTLRAFLSGRLDLTQAEAVLGVIDARSRNQFDTALQQLAGGLAGPLGELRDQLLGLLAELEAGLDFVEEDIEFISDDALRSQLAAALAQLDAIVRQIVDRETSDVLPTVVLIGLPNSGKSSLFNRLVGEEQAIVTEIPGTTTDFVTATVTLASERDPSASSRIQLVDTAGWEVARTAIMSHAQQHRQRLAEQADVRVLCLDAQQWSVDGALERAADQMIDELRPGDLIVLTRQDRLSESDPSRTFDMDSCPSRLRRRGFRGPIAWVSNTTGTGVESLQCGLIEAVVTAGAGHDSIVGTTVRRAAESLKASGRSLRDALAAAEQQLGEEIVAAEIRESLAGLAEVVGEVYTDDLLDVVFGRFCIGK